MNEDYERTVISITDENDVKSTISLEKWTSDVLHEHFDDVHALIQRVYDEVCKQDTTRKLKLSRRKRGDYVRNLANKKAMELEPIELDLSDIELWFKS